MSHVIAAPETIAAAAADIATIGSTLDVAHAAAALPTAGLIPAAADEVSGSIAQVFSVHAQEYQALARQATAYHEQFAQTLAANSASYASTEATITSSLRTAAGSFGTALDTGIGLVFGLQAQRLFENLPALFIYFAAGAVVISIIALIFIAIAISWLYFDLTGNFIGSAPLLFM